MVKKSLSERWIDAMCKLAWSLVGYQGYTEQDARFICKCFYERAPQIAKLKSILALEEEVRNLPEIPPMINQSPSPSKERGTGYESSARVTVKKRRQGARMSQSNPNDYPSPWCKVIKDGKVIRYEDASGNTIPKSLWEN